VGDLLVRPRSACGDTGDEQRMPFPAEHVHGLSGLHHLNLLNHPAVYARIRGWLANRPDAAGRPPALLCSTGAESTRPGLRPCPPPTR
jgi:hypothetical protein